jgi:hypothetical protein
MSYCTYLFQENKSYGSKKPLTFILKCTRSCVGHRYTLPFNMKSSVHFDKEFPCSLTWIYLAFQQESTSLSNIEYILFSNTRSILLVKIASYPAFQYSIYCAFQHWIYPAFSHRFYIASNSAYTLHFNMEYIYFL